MDTIACPHCRFAFELAAGMRAPPWCRRCGGDLNGRAIGSGEPAEELVALTVADAAPVAAGRWASRPARPTPTAPAPRTPTAVADTPAPAGTGRWAAQRRAAASPPPVRAADLPPAAGRALDPDAAYKAVYGTDRDAPPGTPPWAYVFAAACFGSLILVIGYLPFLIASGGASACVGLARSRNWGVIEKLVGCVLIVVGVWAVMLAFGVMLVLAGG